jgi:hypothetical protein
MSDIDFDNLAGGLNYRDTYAQMGKNQNIFWIESSNVKPFKGTGLEKCRGNTIALNHGTKIISAGNLNLGNMEYMYFVDSSGNMYEYDSDGGVKSSALMTGLSGSARGAWTAYGQGIIYTNGIDEPFGYFRGRTTSVSGTVSVTEDSNQVIQDGNFTYDITDYVQKGDSITINGENHIIDDMVATLTSTRVKVTSGSKIVKQDGNFDNDFTEDLEEDDTIIINGETHVIDSIEARDFASGRVNTTAGSKTIIQSDGYTTDFTNEFEAGDYIRIDIEDYLIDTVVSGTEITLDSKATTTLSNQPVTKHAQLTTVSNFAATEIHMTVRRVARITTRSNFAATASAQTITRNKITYLIAVASDGTIIRSCVITTYKGRIYMGYQGGLYWTAQGTYNDWLTEEDAGYNKNFFNDSSTIQALSVYSEFLAIHRKEQVVLMQDQDGTPENFLFVPKANRGSQSQFGITTVQNDHIFFDAGVWSLGETGVLGQILIKSDLAGILNNDSTGFLKGILDTGEVNNITILHYRNKKEIWCYFPVTNLTYYQYVYVFDYEQGIWYRRVTPQEITGAIEHYNRIYSFNSSGEILQEDLGTNWNGTEMDFYVQLAYINFGEEHQEKDIDEIKLLLDTETTNDFDYKVFFNYDNYNSSATNNINQVGDSGALFWSDDQETVTQTEWANDAGTEGNNWAQLIVEGNYFDSYSGVKGISLYLFGSGAEQDMGIVGIKFLGVVENSV